MNESVSKSSLASPSGKSSAANSAESPNSRKIRTIIIARSVPDRPAVVVPAAVRGGGLASTATTPAVVNQHHTRDAKSGKLASYAALGGDEDVERFDQFLAEQRGQPRASELRATTTSPQHMLASMKRKTICEVADGKSGGGGNGSVRKLVQQELENDARKRREEAVAHRKWLNSLPIHERVGQQRQQNALRKWRQMNRDWETFKTRAAKRLGKQPKELVMSRAADYREQREMYDTLQKARPLSDKVGRDVWLVSLRNEGTRYVPVGNIFSGLFCPIRESTQLGPRVRRPLDYHDAKQENEQKTSRPLSKVEKKSLQLLAQKKWRLRKQLDVLQPHEVQQSASSQLAVGTTDLFAWATDSAAGGGGRIDEEGSARSYSASLDGVNSRHRRLLSSQASVSSVDKEELSKQYIGPSLRIVHIADDDEDPAVRPEDEGIQSKSDPMVSYTPLRLSFYTPIGEQQQRSLAITNNGGTIVHYQWWRARFEDESVGLTGHLRGRRTRKEEQELEAGMCTSVSQLGGTLLPGETQQFVFTFESSKAGIFLEKWVLDADPHPRISYGKTALNGGSDTLSAGLPVEVRLSCVAEDNFAAWRRRRKQLACVEERETCFFVALLVDEILDAVRSPEAVTFAELTPRADVSIFYQHNGGNSSGEFSDVYFSPDLVCDCYALYEQAKHILQMLAPLEPPPTIQEENPQNEDGGGIGNVDIGDKEALTEQSVGGDNPDTETDRQEGIATSMLPRADLAEKWDWRLETLREVCKLADEAQHAQIRCLRNQLKKESEEVEDEDDEGDADDDDDDDDDDDGESDETEENAERLTTERGQQVTRRQIRENERLARSKALEDELSSLQPDLQERFDMMRFAAYTAPYSSKRLHERLKERIGSLCSETPVVCETVEMTNATNSAPAAQQAKIEGVRSLLTRAIDEAVSGDQDHQALLEQERRRMQGVWLYDKLSYDSLAQWMAKSTTSKVLPTVISAEDNSGALDIPEAPDNSGVLLLQVDLDVAPWFSLVKADKGSVASTDGAPAKVELTWRFSQDLLQHPTYVPTKVALAAKSLDKVLNSLQSTNAHFHTIVLASELSRPPVTKPMYKLLRYAIQAEIKANSSDEKAGSDETEHNGEHEQEGLESIAMKSLLQRLSSQLSLRNIVPVLQRATQKDIVFCSTLEEAQGQINLGRKDQQLNAVSLGGIDNEAPSEETGIDLPGQQDVVTPPRILLLEHLDAAGINLIIHKASSKPVTPASTIVPHESQKAAAGATKKAPTSTPAKRKPSIPVTAASTPAETLPSSTQDLSKPVAHAGELSRQGIVALRDQFSRMFSGCILDGISSSVCENIFAFSPVEDKQNSMPVTVAGPMLCRELETWAQTLQPIESSTRNCHPRVITAVIGGKCLVSKLRLIDGLLDFVHEIYFVGEVAMSLYRVLHTKQQHKLAANGDKGLEFDEVANNDDDLDNDIVDDDENNVESAMGVGEGISEEETSGNAMKELSRSSKPTSPKGPWDILAAAVEKLEQKASRKCVQLLLPIDWIVGEVPLEEQDASATIVEEDDDEEEEEEDMEEAEEGEDEKNNRKRKASALKTTRQKPLVEPDELDVLEYKKQCTYEGERAQVVLSHASARRTVAPGVGWRTFQDVTVHCLPNARVTEGKASVLTSVYPDTAESETEDGDEEGLSGGDSAGQITPTARFEHEWTFRALDVGPLAMEALVSHLKKDIPSPVSDTQALCRETPILERTLIINGVCGAIEFHEFSNATLQLLGILQPYDPSDVFIAGSSTATWFRQLEVQQCHNASGKEAGSEDCSVAAVDANSSVSLAAVHPRRIVDDRVMRNARVLKSILAAKPHPALSNVMPAESA